MKLPVGLQLYSVRDEMQKDPLATLKVVSELGYDGVEVCGGSYGIDPSEFRRYCDGLGLKIVSAHTGVDTIIDDDKTEDTLALYKTLGVSNIAIPGFWGDYAYGGSKYSEMMTRLKEKAAYFKNNGIGILYHNHEWEFCIEGDKYVLDHILETFGNDDLLPEIDVCWATVGTGNAPLYMKKYTGRCPIVHLKDFYSKGSYYSGEGDFKRPETFAFRPVGYGRVDMVAALDTAVEIGAKWLIVEQDDPAFGLDVFGCAGLSREWLKKVGF